MLLARIVGTVVATRKDERLHGRKLLVARLIDEQGQDQKGHVIAVDTVGAGVREVVLIVQGSSARLASGCKDAPIDAAVGWTQEDGSRAHRVAGTTVEDNMADPDRIAEVYLQLHRQHRSTWAFEVALRPWLERW